MSVRWRGPVAGLQERQAVAEGLITVERADREVPGGRSQPADALALERPAPVCRSPLQERNQLHVSRSHKDGKPFSPLLVRQQQTAPSDPQTPVLALPTVRPATL
jgi:hypothetical protein